MTERALSENCLAYRDRSIRVGPIYGWGWLGGMVPPGFDMRIVEFCRDGNGNIVGGVGVIESQGHTYANHWVVFELRHSGRYNFIDARGHYNVCILRERPAAVQEFLLSHCLQPADNRVDAGYAIIGEPLTRNERWQLRKSEFSQLLIFATLGMPAIVFAFLTKNGAIGILGDRTGVNWYLIKAFALMVIFWGIVLSGAIGLIYGAYHLGNSIV